ncbi:mechanosensitive ion channel family protein [Rheinheimera sp. 4Y26]|uniref:mechanosensitive ion channel family protein n=1 Tax=Rheinheimera sp. 4Y26 TaxID=2977811 RepID=UPI0021B0911F|nr:mechanosensitive ion channel family protein [Rheinheimera sp. 4Y26]MCT6698149.1 mechanosensitive ion channel family protein [Rheinheimera sp. 4Y26]
MKSLLQAFAGQQQWLDPLLAYYGLVLLFILLLSLGLHLLLHHGLLKLIAARSQAQAQWRQSHLLSRLAFTLQGFVLMWQANFWLEPGSETLHLLNLLTQLWVLGFGTASFFALLNTLEALLQHKGLGKQAPIRGLFQSLKLLTSVLVLILALSLLLGKSPLLLLSGLGAMTAILLLVFKDPILGFVAGIQLSANRMLALGDWLEMPKYGADGEVIEMSLTTVKVRNWDNTITSIPAYALISDSFKNWRGMSESGGRRIKRSVFIEASSVRFLTEEDINRLQRSTLLQPYLQKKLSEITAYNAQCDMSSVLNGRRLTNLGTLRAYLTEFLQQHPDIHKNMTRMVRQLPSGPTGIPLEIYAFCSNTAWLHYEAVQGDIFDHIFAVISEFDLRVYQQPSGYDLRQIKIG